MLPTLCATEPVKLAESAEARRRTPRARRGGGNQPNLATVIVRNLLPTLRAQDNDQGNKARSASREAGSSWKGQGRGATLTTAVKMLPTLISSAARSGARPRRATKNGEDLLTLMMPTLRSTDGDRGGRGELLHSLKCGRPRGPLLPTLTASMLTEQDMEQAAFPGNSISRPEWRSGGGRLNPEWCEWFMGWPMGWTALKPLETGRFHEWRRQHSPS